MTDIYMTTSERNDLNELLDVYEKLPPKEQGYIIGVCQGMVYNNTNMDFDLNAEDVSNAKCSTN